jgi:hypothetical protein
VLTPVVLEPVPVDLRPFIASDPAQWACDPLAFIADGTKDGSDDVDPNPPDHPVVTAAIWHGEHHLDLGYLRNAPRLRFWRTVRGDHDEITVDWRHEDDGEIGFTADPAARFSVPTAEYLGAVHALDRELMTAMRQRVEELERRGGLPGMDLDLGQLRREHEDRACWLARNLDRSPKTDWTAVRAFVSDEDLFLKLEVAWRRRALTLLEGARPRAKGRPGRTNQPVRAGLDERHAPVGTDDSTSPHGSQVDRQKGWPAGSAYTKQWSEFGWKSSRVAPAATARAPVVVDVEVEVQLHGYVGAGPHRWAEVVDLLECDEPVRPGDGRPVCASLRDAAGELCVERREGERVGCVHRGTAEPDLVGHHSTAVAW